MIPSDIQEIGLGLLQGMSSPIYLAFDAVICDCGPLNGWLYRTLTVLCLGIIAYFHLRRLPPWDYLVTRAMFNLAWLPAFLASVSFFVLSWRAVVVRGHWPEPMIDDPHVICRNDSLYQVTYRITHGVMDLAGVSIILWVALLLHVALRGLLTGRQIVQLTLVWLLSWTLFGVEPSNRFAWWLD